MERKKALPILLICTLLMAAIISTEKDFLIPCRSLTDEEIDMVMHYAINEDKIEGSVRDYILSRSRIRKTTGPVNAYTFMDDWGELLPECREILMLSSNTLEKTLCVTYKDRMGKDVLLTYYDGDLAEVLVRDFTKDCVWRFEPLNNVGEYIPQFSLRYKA